MNYQQFQRLYKAIETLEKENKDFFDGKLKSSPTTIGNNIERPVEWYFRNYILYSYGLLPIEKQTWLELYAESCQNIFQNCPTHRLIDLWVKWYFEGEN